MDDVISLCDLTGKMLLPWAEAGHKCWAFDTQHPEGESVHPLNANIVRVGMDVRSVDFRFWITDRKGGVKILFSFPPCTDLTGSGARWWEAKGPVAYRDAMHLVYKCAWAGGALGCPWFVENPPGRIHSGAGAGIESELKWRKCDHTFQPYEYGGWDGNGKEWWDRRGGKLWEKFPGQNPGLSGLKLARAFTNLCGNLCELPAEPNDGYHKRTCLWVGGGFKMPERRPIPLNSKPDFIHRCPPGPERANIRSATPLGFARAVYEANRG